MDENRKKKKSVLSYLSAETIGSTSEVVITTRHLASLTCEKRNTLVRRVLSSQHILSTYQIKISMKSYKRTRDKIISTGGIY